MKFNINPEVGSKGDRIKVKGNPIEYFGTGIVGFIDILGFSSQLFQHWSTRDDSPLCKLLRIKDAIPSSKNQIAFGLKGFGNNEQIEFNCRIDTVSDSIVVSIAVSEPISTDFYEFCMASLTISSNILRCSAQSSPKLG